MKGLFLDDVRKPSDVTWLSYPEDIEWYIVRNYNEFVEYTISKGVPEYISFDHDLALEHYTPMEYWDNYSESKKYQEAQNYKEKTGKDVAEWLCNYCEENNIEFPSYSIHSLNPVGKDNIQKTIATYLIKAYWRNNKPGIDVNRIEIIIPYEGIVR